MKKVKKVNRLLRPFRKYAFSFLERQIVIKFLINSKFNVGALYHPLISQFVIGTRRKRCLYNLYFLLTQIRKMLYLIFLHTFFKEKIVVLSTKEVTESLGIKAFFLFSTWFPGFLTNFKQLMRRARAETRYMKHSKLANKLSSALRVKRIPQLPTFSVSLSAHSHWFINEALHLKLISFSTRSQYNANLLPFNKKRLPTAIMLRLIRETIFASKLNDRLFFKRFRKKKIKETIEFASNLKINSTITLLI